MSDAIRNLLDALESGIWTDGDLHVDRAARRAEQDLHAMVARLAQLDAYLEARGLPLDTPPERWGEWGWVVYTSRGGVPALAPLLRYAECDRCLCMQLDREGLRPMQVIRWDHATTEQREQARKMEVER